jgi:hypothetical protein
VLVHDIFVSFKCRIYSLPLYLPPPHVRSHAAALLLTRWIQIIEALLLFRQANDTKMPKPFPVVTITKILSKSCGLSLINTWDDSYHLIQPDVYCLRSRLLMENAVNPTWKWTFLQWLNQCVVNTSNNKAGAICSKTQSMKWAKRLAYKKHTLLSSKSLRVIITKLLYVNKAEALLYWQKKKWKYTKAVTKNALARILNPLLRIMSPCKCKCLI